MKYYLFVFIGVPVGILLVLNCIIHQGEDVIDWLYYGECYAAFAFVACLVSLIDPTFNPKDKTPLGLGLVQSTIAALSVYTPFGVWALINQFA
jgi:hypothetical protein